MDNRRLAFEKKAVEALCGESWFTLNEWKLHKECLTAEGVITAHQVEYPVRLVYPDQFPSVPAWVEPQDPEAKWSNHQYGAGGTLCLELRPDNWSPAATGADVLRSAYNLLDTENPLGEGEHGEVESGHSVGAIQRYDWQTEPVIVSLACLVRLMVGTAEDARAVRWRVEDEWWPMLVTDSADRAAGRQPPGFDFGSLRVEVPLVVVRSPPPTGTPADRASLAATLGIELDPEQYKSGVIVIAATDDDAVAFYSLSPDKVERRRWLWLTGKPGDRSARAADAREKKVAIVGCGSVGSKVAESILRSGIHRLVLVDGDVFLPENLERHTLDWRDVGARKCKAVKRRLLQVVPTAFIHVIAANLNWQRSAKVQAESIEAIANCDLIIDATGDAPTSLMLGSVAAENSKPFVSVEVFEGGLGCAIGRAIPARDPAFIDGRARYLAYCEEQRVEPPASGSRPYEALAGEGATVVADDSAVTITAGHCARVALDILDDAVQPEDAAWLLLGFKRGWLFTGHGHSLALDVGGPIETVEEELDPEATALAVRLAREVIDAAKAAK